MVRSGEVGRNTVTSGAFPPLSTCNDQMTLYRSKNTKGASGTARYSHSIKLTVTLCTSTETFESRLSLFHRGENKRQYQCPEGVKRYSHNGVKISFLPVMRSPLLSLAGASVTVKPTLRIPLPVSTWCSSLPFTRSMQISGDCTWISAPMCLTKLRLYYCKCVSFKPTK